MDHVLDHSADITDAAGRVLTWRAINAAESVKLRRAGGKRMDDPDHADLVITVACIRAIDGKPCRLPRNGAEIGRAMHRLGEVGVACSGAFGRIMIERLEGGDRVGKGTASPG